MCLFWLPTYVRDKTVLLLRACCTPRLYWYVVGSLYPLDSIPVTPRGRIGKLAAVIVLPDLTLSPGLDRDTLFNVGLAFIGGLTAPLYISLPWMRSNIIANPPRMTVLFCPVRSYAKPTPGAKFADVLFTSH